MLAALENVDLAEVEYKLGTTSYQRGFEYAHQNAVTKLWWDPAESALHGAVRGGAVYSTLAYFSRSGEFEQGQCTCPVGFNCKHVAALVVTAAHNRKAKTPTWERSLGALLDPDVQASRSGDVPLALELTSATNSRLLGRLVRPGKNGWVSGGLSWTRLGSLHHYHEYLPAHVRLLQELYAVHWSNDSGSHYYGYHDVKSIDLSTFESSRLWSMLEDARSIGLRLVHGRYALGDIEPHGVARVCLDVTGEGKVVTPVLAVDGEPADPMPVGFIGKDDGHGVVYVDRAQAEQSAERGTWRIRLARLEKPVPPQLQRMVLENQTLKIPKAGRARFRDEFYPRLRRLAAVTSSDDTFTPPAISGPTLVLRASYGAEHSVDIDWEWAYQVGDSSSRVPVDAAEADGSYRDPEAERAVLAELDLPLGGLELAPEHVARARLSGIDTMRFTTEMLPLLDGHPGVEVEVGGEPADYREATDSLSIGVSAGEISGETDWFDLGITISVEERRVPFVDVFQALSRGESHVLLPDGAYFSLEKPELGALARLIEEARALQDTAGGPLRISRFQAGLWEELAELGVVEHQSKAWQRQVRGLLSAGSVDPAEVPATLDASLRPYQVDGFGWLAFLWEFQLGGILADDMGLGKTLQSLALICHAKQKDPDGAPFLIVAPTSVVSNWAAETARFAPGLRIEAISDTLRRRGQTLDEIVAGADIVVTSYTLFRLDFEAYSASPWSGLVLDEAQFAKNHQSKVHQCARMLAAPFKLAITGTPMENNLMELWSLLSITAPGLFPSPAKFKEYYGQPIEKRGDTDRLAQLRRRIKPLVKRRTKEQVIADLPAKQEQVLEVELHPRHRKIYQTHLQRERQKVLGLIDDMNKNRFTILRSLTLLRQLSLHAALVDEKHRGLPCGKIDTLLEQLHDVIDGGHRALVFSQFTGFLGVVRACLDEAGVEYCYLDGKTRNRARVLKRFKEGTDPVFLISLKAGGFGLNLTEADYCFLLDPWWNPATEQQAVDRTHRIGQTRNVMVYRLIAKDTIEEKVMALKAKKAELFANVMDDGNAFGTGLDADDIRGLFD